MEAHFVRAVNAIAELSQSPTDHCI